VAGKTSDGKSALANTSALGAVKEGNSVLCATLEDDAAAAVCRMMSRVSGVSNSALQRRMIEPGQWPAFLEAASELAPAPIAFIERAESVDKLCADIRAHVLAEKTDLVIVDYLQLIRTNQGRSQQERTDHVLGELVHLAHGMTSTATLLVSQLRRVGDARPTKEDLYHSGAIEQWAHTIGILWRPPVKVPGCVSLLIEKQKNGPTGRVTLGWDARTCSYTNPGPNEERDYDAAVSSLKAVARK
jgi:replicative DNA helicase